MSSDAAIRASLEPWPRIRLRDLVDERGVTYGVVQPGQPQKEGVPIVRVNNITPAGLQMDDVMQIDPKIAQRYQRSRLKGGEVLITLVGSVGNVAVAPPDLAGWNVARAVGVIPVRRGVSARWVAWCLRTPETAHYLEARLNTTVQKTLNLRDLAALEVPVPSARVIEAVSSVLGTIDDKIASNRRLSALLADAFALRFEAVSKSAASHANASAGSAEWVLSDLGDVHRSMVKGDSDLPYIGLDVMPRGSTVLTEWTTEDAPTGQAATFDVGDILFGKLRPYFKKVGVAPITGRCSTEILVLRPKDPRYYGVLLGHVSSQRFIDHCVAVSKGTKMPRAEWKDASSMRVCVLSTEEAAELTKLAHTLFAQIRGLTRESHALDAVRRQVLPWLMSGRLPLGRPTDQNELIEQSVEDLIAQ